MALFASPEDKCVQTLKTLHANRIKLEAAIVERESELARLKAGASEDSALDSFLADTPLNSEGFPTVTTASVEAVERKLSELRGARLALARRIRAGIVDLGGVRAGEFRKQAAKLQGELDKHLARSAELLAALETHTRIRYAPDRIGDADILTDAAGRESVFRRGDKPAPRSQELASEIAILRRKADAAEQRARDACEGGQVAASTLPELLKVCDNLETLAPTRAAIEAWFQQAAAKAEAEWSVTAGEYAGTNFQTGKYQPAPEHDTVYTLAWSPDGVIDPARSKVTNRPGRLTMPAAASVEAASDARRW